MLATRAGAPAAGERGTAGDPGPVNRPRSERPTIDAVLLPSELLLWALALALPALLVILVLSARSRSRDAERRGKEDPEGH